MKRRVLLVVAALAGMFYAGRYSAPVEVREVVRTEWKTVYQIQQVEKAVRVEGRVRVVERRVEVPGPAGPTVTIYRTEDRGPVTSGYEVERIASGSTVGESTSERVELRARPEWRASVAADPLRLSLNASAFRFGVERRILGPLWFGASYQHGGTALVSIAGEF